MYNRHTQSTLYRRQASIEENRSRMKNRHVRYLKLVLLPALLLNILIYCIAVVVLQPQSAFAHAYVIGSDPVDGSTVTVVPKVVRIYFNANISSMSVTQVLYVQNGDYVSVQTHSLLATNTMRELDTFLPTELAGGSYLVRWTAVANDDGHTTFGSIGFDVGHTSTGVQGTPTLGPSSSNCVGNTCVNDIRKLDLLGLLAVAWEWLVLVALTLWIGILVTERLIFARVEHVTDLLDRARRQAVPLQWLCLSALLVGEVVTLALRSVHITRALNNGVLDFSALPALLTETWYGRLWMVRCLLIILALILLWWMTRPPHAQETNQTAQRLPATTRTGPLRLQQAGIITATTGSIKAIRDVLPVTTTAQLQRYSGLWFLLAGLILCTYALTENAVSIIQPHMSAVVLSGLSLLAQYVWFGGLAYLGYVVLPLLSIVDLDSNTETIISFLRRMTPFIVGGIVIQLVSLLFLSETTINAPHLLVDDAYGRSLLVRLILIALALLVSFYILFVIRPKLTRQTLLLPVVNAELPVRRTRQSALERTTRHLRTLVNVQALLGGGVLFCAALMSFYAPTIVFPNISYTHPPVTTTTSTPTENNTQQQKIGTFTVGLQVSPGRLTNANTVIVSITDVTGKAVTNARVEIITNMQGMDMGTAIQKATRHNATYVATFAPGEAFSMSGFWNIGIHFQIPGQAVQKVSFQVTIVGG
ncbi:MAG: copper transporter YcnJ [Ktedonobacteraceae bacterium]